MEEKYFRHKYEVRHEWWKPYTNNRTGIGMAQPLETDLSKEYGIKGKTLERISLYGLQSERNFVALTTVLQFPDSYVLIDRAEHKLRDARIVNADGSLGSTISRIPYLAILKEERDKDINPVRGNFPIHGVEAKELFVEKYSNNKVVREFEVGGMLTLAVGLLPEVIRMTFEDQEFLRFEKRYFNKGLLEQVFDSSEGLHGLDFLLMYTGSRGVSKNRRVSKKR